MGWMCGVDVWVCGCVGMWASGCVGATTRDRIPHASLVSPLTFQDHDAPTRLVVCSIFGMPRQGESGVGVASGTAAYYSFTHGTIHFIVLNSFDIDNSPRGSMMTWATADVRAAKASGKAQWVVVVFHHPPYSWGKPGQLRTFSAPPPPPCTWGYVCGTSLPSDQPAASGWQTPGRCAVFLQSR